jgi:hypothetical protein
MLKEFNSSLSRNTLKIHVKNDRFHMIQGLSPVHGVVLSSEYRLGEFT